MAKTKMDFNLTVISVHLWFGMITTILTSMMTFGERRRRRQQQ
jgi:hypothetical protein